MLGKLEVDVIGTGIIGKGHTSGYQSMSNDVDVVALLENGFYIFVECKHKKSINDDPAQRLLAISSGIAPRSSIPVIVYSGNETEMNDNQGVVQISWPDLANPLIGIHSTNHRKLALFMKSNSPSVISNAQIENPDKLKARGEFVERIGNALVTFLDGSSCTWIQASGVIKDIITTEQKKEFFGSKKFSASKARKYLSEFVSVTGDGNDALVEPVLKTSE